MAITRALTDRGHAVTSAPSAMAGLQIAIDQRPDLVVLDARIRAVLRRGPDESTDGAVAVGGLRLDARARDATLDDVRLDLTPREFDLLHYLASRAGEVISKRELLTEVWRLPYGGADKT